MEKNLNVAPTEQELLSAGFKQTRRTGIDYCHFSYSKEINDSLILIVDGSDTGIWYKNENKAKLIHPIEPTKAAINAEFEHFGQPLPQWEKPQPHQYSYKGLKAAGKIPHDRSGEDHESIEAFKKLLAICEALNGMFEKFEDSSICSVYYDNGLCWAVNSQPYESPIYFTSKEAFDAFKSAPENVELFKTFLKLK